MYRLFLLYRTLRKCDSVSSAAKGEKSSVEIPIDPVKMLEIIAVLGAIGGIGYLGYRFFYVIDLIGGAAVVMKNLGFILGLITSALSLIHIINSLYMSSDIGLLITMPLSAVEIVAAKIMNSFINSFLILAGVLLSFLSGYSIHGSVTLTVWIGMVFYVFMIPLFTTGCMTNLLLFAP